MTETVSVTMPDEMLRAVRESVEAGEYASTDAALSDAVRVWQRERTEHAERIASIKARIRKSVDDPRPALSSDEVREHLDAMFAQARAEADRA